MAAIPSFRGVTLDGFVDHLASSEAVPGGGSASAVTASLGAALLAMVASLSEGRPKYEQHAALHAEAKSAGKGLADRLLTIADDDAAAYAFYASAMKLPRESDDERAARERAMARAARGASEVPLRCVEACLEIVVYAEALAGRSNRSASSDLEVAALLANAAAAGAGANVLVNLPSIGDETHAVHLRARTTELLHDIERLAEATRERVRAGDAREPLEGPVAA